MLIRGAHIAISPTRTTRQDLWVSGGSISFSAVESAQSISLDLDGHLILPGLINAHDHLELNLFPRLGCGPYSNASAWAKDVYHPQDSPVKQHLQVSKSARLQWGGIKNLISGVTTVAHHNAYHPIFSDPSFPVRVIKRYGWAHSLDFSPDWQMRFRTTPSNYSFVIHAAEGTDEAASREVQLLANAGVLDRNTVLVHGVGIGSSDWALIKKAQSGLVWCPSSNYFTLNRTLDMDALNSGIPIALGSDSAMTADGDLLDEMQTAHRMVDSKRLYRMVTSEPARMFRLPWGFGRICHKGPADLLIVRSSGKTPATTLLEEYPNLVMVRGRIQLVSYDLAQQLPPTLLKSLQPIEVNHRGRYLIAGEISSLLDETTRVLLQPPCLAGRAIAA